MGRSLVSGVIGEMSLLSQTLLLETLNWGLESPDGKLVLRVGRDPAES